MRVPFSRRKEFSNFGSAQVEWRGTSKEGWIREVVGQGRDKRNLKSILGDAVGIRDYCEL